MQTTACPAWVVAGVLVGGLVCGWIVLSVPYWQDKQVFAVGRPNSVLPQR